MPRVVDLQELCRLPHGQVFSAYEPCIVAGLNRRLEPLCRKHEYNEPHDADCEFIDFFYNDLLATPNLCDNPRKYDPNNDKDMDFMDLDDSGRWATYQKDELFVIYEEADVKLLVALLTNTHKEE